jgi:pilus assembly protein Flp/PilA
MRTLRWFITDEAGQDMIEYALLASLVAVVSIAALKALGTKVAGFYNTVGTNL